MPKKRRKGLTGSHAIILMGPKYHEICYNHRYHAINILCNSKRESYYRLSVIEFAKKDWILVEKVFPVYKYSDQSANYEKNISISFGISWFEMQNFKVKK